MQNPLPVENNYVAPWAMAAQQPMTDQQRSYIYGNSQQTQYQDPQNGNWSQAPPGMGQSPISPQQHAMLYGSPSIPSQSASLSLPPPPSAAGQRQEYFAHQKQVTPSQSEFQPNNLPFRDSSMGGGGTLVPFSSGSQEKPALGKSVPQAVVKPLTAQQLARNEDPMKSLFGDLVDLQPAKPKKIGENPPSSSTSMAASRFNARA